MPIEGITDSFADLTITDDYIIVSEDGSFFAVDGRSFLSYEDEEFFISSEIYPVLVEDNYTMSGDALDGNHYMFGSSLDLYQMSGTLQGNHSLSLVRQEHEVYDVDGYEMSGGLQGNHVLSVVRVEHDVYDVDTYEMTGLMQGNHALTVVRIDHEVYDIDTYEMTGTLQGNHTLV